MTKYEVKNAEGVDINGDHYAQGHEFEFDTLPDHIQTLVDDGSLAMVVEDDDVDESEQHADDGADEEKAKEGDAAAGGEAAANAEGEAAAE